MKYPSIKLSMLQRQLISLAFATLLFTVPLSAAEKGIARTGLNRVALVVGNSNYSGEIGRLGNPVNDVRTMARSLEQAGFLVTKLEDTGYSELREAIWDFGKRLREADAALFYFSGHGVQYNGSNYLLPLGTRLETPRHIQLQAVSENEVLAEMEGGTEDRVNIVIVDACRNNLVTRGFRSAQKGLAPTLADFQPKGSVIAYATAPGKLALDGEGANSPYVSELSTHLLTPGLKIEEVFKRVLAGVEERTQGKQTPWVNYSLKGDFYFVPASGELAVADQSRWAERQQQMQIRFEQLRSAQEAQRESDLAEWQKFLSEHADDNPFSDKDEQLRQNAQNEIAFLNRTTAPATIAAVPDPPSEKQSSNPESIKLMKTYRLAKNRGLETLAEQSLQALVSKHLGTPEGGDALALLLMARLEKEGVNRQTEETLLALEKEHPDSPQVARVRKQAAGWLLGEGDKRLEARDYDAALAHYEKAGGYGAGAAALQERRARVQETRIRHLIEGKHFQEAEEALVLWEVSGEAPQASLSALHRRRLKVQDDEGALANYEKAASYGADADTLHRKQAGIKEQQIRVLINAKRFREAEEALARWKASGDTSSNLDELRAYLKLQKDAEQRRLEAERQRMANRRREVRSLIDAGAIDDAEIRLTRWQASGEDAEGLQELQAYLEANAAWTESVTGMKFQKIPGGSFMMGSPSSEKNRSRDENQHTVQVDVFWLAETEVTQAQWQAVMGSNPSKFRGNDLPVEQVSFNDVQEFIKRLNARTGKRFRLPTEAEWEYAARAGTGTARHWGEAIGSSNANCDGCGSHWDNKQTAPVGGFQPNAFGLHDVLGNVREWTCSEYESRYDGSEQECADRASRYSLRGGSWASKPWYVRSAARYNERPGKRSYYFGFRLARD